MPTDSESDLPVQGMWIDLQKARWAMDPCDLRDRIDKAIRSKFGQNEVPGVGPFTESPLQVRPMDPTVKAARESVTLTSYEIELEAERDALRADLEAIHVDAARVNQENNALRAALRYHVESEDGPCRLDHHGYCQDHNSFEEGECRVRVHRRLLGLEVNDD